MCNQSPPDRTFQTIRLRQTRSAIFQSSHFSYILTIKALSAPCHTSSRTSSSALRKWSTASE